MKKGKTKKLISLLLTCAIFPGSLALTATRSMAAMAPVSIDGQMFIQDAGNGSSAAELAEAQSELPPYPVTDTEGLTFGVKVTYGQTEGRNIADLVNEFRTGNDAWYWNEDDETKTAFAPNELHPLEYDYGLEKVAMQRAAELALAYSHTRPNGEDCFEAYDEFGISFGWWGENIAIGYRNAESVFEAWQETHENYDGQGHRRNMLSEDYFAIGIGHAVYDGINLWVQEFSNSHSGAPQEPANDSEAEVSVEVAQSKITEASISSDADKFEMSEGQTLPLPKVATTVRLDETWGPLGKVQIIDAYEWESENPQIVEIQNGKAIARQAGKTTLTCTSAPGYPGITGSLRIQASVLPKIQKIAAVKVKGGPGSLTVSWKKDAKASGYQILVARDSKFKKGRKSVTVQSAKTVQKTIKWLSPKKTYYVKVRAYKESGGEKIYGVYSAARKGKTADAGK